MHEITLRILWRDNVQDLLHIVQNPIALITALDVSVVVVLVPPQKMLDLAERFFDGVEIGGIGWQVLDTNTKTIGDLDEFITLVNSGVVEH